MSASLDDGLTLFLPISPMWKMAELPLSVNRAREGWDIHYLYREQPGTNALEPMMLANASMGHLIASAGLQHLAQLPDDATTDDVSDEVRARFENRRPDSTTSATILGNGLTLCPTVLLDAGVKTPAFALWYSRALSSSS